MKLVDKAFNAHTYTFKDTLVFETVNTPNAYKLDADMVNAKWLSMQLSSGEDAGVTGYKYRIIHESDSLEVTGMADSLGASSTNPTAWKSPVWPIASAAIL